MRFKPIQLDVDPIPYAFAMEKHDDIIRHAKHMDCMVKENTNVIQVTELVLKDVQKIIYDRFSTSYFSDLSYGLGTYDGDFGLIMYYEGRSLPIICSNLEKLAMKGHPCALYLFYVINTLKLDFYCSDTILKTPKHFEIPDPQNEFDEQLIDFVNRLKYYEKDEHFTPTISAYDDVANVFMLFGFEFEKTKQELEDDDWSFYESIYDNVTNECFISMDFFNEDQIQAQIKYFENVAGWHKLMEEMEQFFIRMKREEKQLKLKLK